jgi:hypothetical protein
VFVVLGLSRALVICRAPDGTSHLTCRVAGACCHGDDDLEASSAAPIDSTSPSARGGAACEHTSLAIELGLPEQNKLQWPAAVDAAIMARPMRAAPSDTPTALLHPHATGPPRADRHAALRATTLLLL